MAQAVSNPRVTFNLVTSENRVGPDDQRCLVVGQMKTGSATAGALTTDVPRSNAEINTLFGADSHIAMILRGYRGVNEITNVDAIALADNGSGTAATAIAAFSGTATGSGSLYLTIVSDENHKYQIDVAVGDTASSVASKALALINADINVPFTAAVSTATLTATAANKGPIANDWLISIKGYVAGISCTLTGWTGGATSPSLTSLWDVVQTMRYQTVIWPSAYPIATLKAFLDPRKNVENDIMDGRGFTFHNVAFGTVKTDASGCNSSEVVILTNEPTSTETWKGAHLPEAPDVITAKFAAARDLRFEPDASISNVVSTNAANDQFGGPHLASLPYFNTPLLGVGTPLKGSGYTFAEQRELEGSGVSIIGVNRTGNACITGVIVTTWLNDAAGNRDNTWKFLEWRDTHGWIREYFQRNCQKEFRQHRLTSGTAVPGYAMVDEQTIRAFLKLLYIELSQMAITVDGLVARKFFEDRLTVKMDYQKRQVKIAAKVPMVSQLGELIGSIEYTFEAASGNA